MSELERVRRLLPVPLTEFAVAERAQELAQAELYRGQVDRDFLAEAEEWKARKKLWESKVMTASEACQRLGRIVKERQEDRDVECVVFVDGGVYRLVRTDTGEEIVRRPATPGELQLALPVE